jgi:hypothetical protein
MLWVGTFCKFAQYNILLFFNFILKSGKKFVFFSKISDIKWTRKNLRHGKRYNETSISWWHADKLHRTNGPAMIYFKGTNAGLKEWWINGKQIECKSNKEFKKLMKLKAFM